MRKEEFAEFIRSFNKKPGEYTKEELFQIGLEHKKLDDRDKSWKALCNVVGWPGTPESYRCSVNRQCSTMEPLLEDKVADTDYVTALRELYKEKTKLRDINNEYHRHIRNEARIEVLREELQNAANRLPSLPKVISPKSSKQEETEAILTFSDLHIGPEFVNSYNSYSYEKAVARVNQMVADTIRYCKAHNVKRLNFLNMGDLISGTIHTTLRIEQTYDITDQIMKAAELTAEVLNQLQAAAPEITYRSVTDNHSRAIPDKNDNIECENFNRLIDWFVEARLKGTKVQFPHDNIDVSVGRFKLNNQKLVLFAHGHLEKKTTVVQDLIGLTKEIPDYVLLAHYHNSAEKTFQGVKVIITGCIIGTDPYAYNKRLFSHPEQKLLIFDKDNLINITLDLDKA